MSSNVNVNESNVICGQMSSTMIDTSVMLRLKLVKSNREIMWFQRSQHVILLRSVFRELIELKDHYLRSTCMIAMIAVKVMMNMLKGSYLQSQSGHMSILKVKSQVKQQVGGKSMDGVFR